MWPLRNLSAALAALVVVATTAGSSARAAGPVPDTAWSARGLLLCGQPNAQDSPAMALSAAGGFFVAWADARANADTSDLYVLSVLGDGMVAPGWPANGAACSLAPGSQRAPQIAADDAGGVLAVWEDYRAGSTSRLFAQHLSATGLPLAGWPVFGVPVCNRASIQRAPKLVADGAGGALIFWEDYRDPQPRIYAQHMKADGSFATGWPDTGRAVATVTGGQVAPAAAADGAGGAYVTWSDGRGGGATSIDIYAQRLNGDGTPFAGWPASGQAVCTAPGAQDRPSVAADGTGGAVFAWTDPRNGAYNIHAQRFTGAGVVDSQWPADGYAVSNAAPGQFDPVLASDGQGAVLVAWVDARGGLGNADIYAQRLGANSSPQWADDGFAVCRAPGDQLAPRLVHDGAGGILVCWQDGRFAPDTRLFVQRVSAAGAIAPGWPVDGRMGADTNLVVEPAVMLPDGAGGAYCAWSGVLLPAGPSGPDLFASRIAGNGVVPALTALVSADANPLGVVLRWWTSWQNQPLALERAAGDEGQSTAGEVAAAGWQRVATVWAEAGGLVRWDDHSVVAGRRYGYRLRAAQDVGGEVWVTVPRAGLAISRDGAGPADDRVTYVLSLAREGPATLEIFDVAGRRRASLALAGIDRLPRVTLDISLLAPGSYRVRLRQGEATARATLLVLR